MFQYTNQTFSRTDLRHNLDMQNISCWGKPQSSEKNYTWKFKSRTLLSNQNYYFNPSDPVLKYKKVSKMEKWHLNFKWRMMIIWYTVPLYANQMFLLLWWQTRNYVLDKAPASIYQSFIAAIFANHVSYLRYGGYTFYVCKFVRWDDV